jgi:hypothetical protein
MSEQTEHLKGESNKKKYIDRGRNTNKNRWSVSVYETVHMISVV